MAELFITLQGKNVCCLTVLCLCSTFWRCSWDLYIRFPRCEPDRCMLTEWKRSVLSVNLTPSWRCQSAGEHARHAARQDEWEILQQRDHMHAVRWSFVRNHQRSKAKKKTKKNCYAESDLEIIDVKQNKKNPFSISGCWHLFISATHGRL